MPWNITIGKMIEILKDYGVKISCAPIAPVVELPYANSPSLVYSNEELCDALWEAVKSII